MSTLRLKPAEVVDYGVYVLYRALGWFLRCLPLRGVFYLGRLAGWLGYLFLGGYRRLAAANIRIAFPDWSREEVEHCSKRHFMDLMANLLCSFVLLEKPWEEVRKHLDVSDFERATERINGAKSVLWTINHLGNWELFIFCAALVRPGRHGSNLPGVAESIYRRAYPPGPRQDRFRIDRAEAWTCTEHKHPEGGRDVGNPGGPTCRG